MLLVACSGPPQYKDYYVAIQGNNSTGNGSSSKPWRTIQYALDHASYAGSSIVRINLAKGIYNENIVIDDEVIISGAGSSQFVTSGSNPDIPVQQVSVIARQLPPNLPVGETAKSVNVTGVIGEVRLENLNVFGGGVTANDSDLTLDNVIVYGVTGFYGVEVTDSSFSILDSRIQTQSGYLSDYGLSIVASSGFFTNSYVGDRFDHAINIIPWTGAHNVNPYSLPIPLNIYITGATVKGSPIYYADGIRIQGPANVIIRDSEVTRAPGSAAAASGISHNPPYAGIEVAGWMVADNTMRRVEIIDTQTAGFDVGIGVNISTVQLKVEGSTIQGISYGVRTSYNEYTDAVEPVVDFGGGLLGSQGNNIFSDQPKYAYYHATGTYPVRACYNDWNVLGSQIDSLRVYDKLDDPSLGRIFFNCLSPPNPTATSALPLQDSSGQFGDDDPTLIAIPIQNVNCREGNSTLFEIADTLLAGSANEPTARGVDNLWLQFAGPTYGEPCWVFVNGLTLFLNDAEVEIDMIPEAVLSIVQYPPPPTATPTMIPEAEDTETPEPASPQCDDGIDNDGDGFVDMADRECRSSSDDDEANP